MTGEFTILAMASVIAVVAVELLWFRTGIFRSVTFWVAYAIIVFFEVLVDGWLTKLSAPIVIYDEDEFSGVRFPFDIPVEDYLFGFSLIVLTLILWERAGPRYRAGRGRAAGGVESSGPEGTEPTLPR
ncbi:MAG: lycopene cyclase domain-containing protein [Actinobacteria bacterium]|nr:lycopene cyclase domain-containing protein [Actinomycetota bacterium]